MTANHVLGIFRHDLLYLFLGAAFTTLGFLSGALSLLRRKFDAMLFWLAHSFRLASTLGRPRGRSAVGIAIALVISLILGVAPGLFLTAGGL